MNEERGTKNAMPLYHISDQSGIKLFEPRPSRQDGEPLVWAIDEAHLPSYLLLRDCPRVTFCVAENTTTEDTERFFCGTTAKRVIAIESTWLPRFREERLCRYEFDADGFRMLDDNAGYYVCSRAVMPVSETGIDDVLAELLQHDIELRIMPSLWKLREAVINSTLEFSIIRMQNAQPPVEGYEAYTPLP